MATTPLSHHPQVCNQRLPGLSKSEIWFFSGYNKKHDLPTKTPINLPQKKITARKSAVRIRFSIQQLQLIISFTINKG